MLWTRIADALRRQRVFSNIPPASADREKENGVSTTNQSLPDIRTETDALLKRLGVDPAAYGSGTLLAKSPITGAEIGRVIEADAARCEATIAAAHAAFLEWRKVPAPLRGEFVRLLGEELRAAKADLGRLVTIEARDGLQTGVTQNAFGRTAPSVASRSRCGVGSSLFPRYEAACGP